MVGTLTNAGGRSRTRCIERRGLSSCKNGKATPAFRQVENRLQLRGKVSHFGVAVATLALLLFAVPLAALDSDKPINQYMHDVWQTEEGLPQVSVLAMVNTRDGYLWCGTQEGLVRFDGVRFTVFDKANTPEMVDNHIRSLFEDQSGRLWVGTNSGGLLLLENGSFRRFSTRDGLSHNSVVSLLEDWEGNLWIGTNGGGLNRYSDGTFTSITTKEGLTSDRVFALHEDRHGNLWVGTSGGGLNRLRNGKLTAITTADGLSSNDVRSLREDRDGNLWIGTYGGGLNRLRDGKLTAITKADGLTSDNVFSLLEDRDGNLWIGTNGGGLNRLHQGELTAVTSEDGLSNDFVVSLLEDRESNLWVGTSGGGLNRFREGKLTTITTAGGLSRNGVFGILEDRDGSLWIGTNGGGLNRLHRGQMTTITTDDGLSSDFVVSLLEGRDESLWIGTYGGGLNRLHEGKITSITTNEGLSSDIIWSLLEDRKGTLWVGTYGGGLNRIAGERVTAITTDDGLTSDDVVTLLEDHEGTLWIGTDGGGLNRLHDGKLTAIRTSDGLSNDFVLSLHEDRNGALWIGTSGGGLNRLEDGRLAAITTREGLFDDVVYRILEDDLGYFWMSCNRGIYRVAKRELDAVADGKQDQVTSVAYGTTDGMESAECNGRFEPAGWKTRDGRLWFPTMRGVVVADPRNLSRNKIVPPVIIEETLVDETLVERSGHLSLPPGTQKLEIHYTALSLVAPKRNRFRYRLDGYDEGWVDAGTRRTAFYTNLPSGEYTFRVIAANNDGLWNEEGAALPFEIKPHVYETWWFRVIVIVTIGSIFLASYKLRTNYLKANANALRLVVDERTRELRTALDEAEEERMRAEAERARAEEASRAKSVFLANMSHELRTPLNGILGFAQIMERNTSRTPEDRRHLATILRCGDTLLDLINDVLSLSKIEAGRVFMHREPFDLENLLRGLEEMLCIRAESKRLTFTMEIEPGIPDQVIGDETRLRQILTNLLGNALKFTERGGVVLRARWTEGRGLFEVEDTGPGITSEELQGLFAPFVQTETGRRSQEGTGLGLAISRSFAQMMGGDVTVTSVPGCGSCFRVEVALPAASDAEGSDHEERESRMVISLAPGQQKIRVLVADDLDDNRRLLVELLRSVGFDVREAINGVEAVRIWRRWRPHLIWMDKRMPKMDGIEATRVIRKEERQQRGGRVVIIALSASALEHERGDILAAGCDDFLPKPFREGAIFAKMAKQLDLKYAFEGDEGHVDRSVGISA